MNNAEKLWEKITSVNKEFSKNKILRFNTGNNIVYCVSVFDHMVRFTREQDGKITDTVNIKAKDIPELIDYLKYWYTNETDTETKS